MASAAPIAVIPTGIGFETAVAVMTGTGPASPPRPRRPPAGAAPPAAAALPPASVDGAFDVPPLHADAAMTIAIDTTSHAVLEEQPRLDGRLNTDKATISV